MTKCPWRAWSCLMIVTILGRAQNVPKITLMPFNSRAISVTQLTSTSLLNPKVRIPNHTGTPSQALIALTNKSDKPVVITVLAYITKNSANATQKRISTCDASLAMGNRPIALPNSTAILGPHQCLPQELDTTGGQIGISSAGATDAFLVPLINATEVTEVLDAVVFADGEIVGPDTYHRAADAVARAAASVDLARRIRAATARGTTISSAVRQILASIPGTSGQNASLTPDGQKVARELMWTRRLAQGMTRNSHPEAQLSWLEGQRGPFLLHRSDRQ